MYVEHTVQCLREIRRVLRDDGTVFWNLADTYYANKRGNTNITGKHEGYDIATKKETLESKRERKAAAGIPPKSLCLIPWRVTIAAQDDGWIVRDIIAWQKTAPMPESVTDRCTKAWEAILMLTKSEKYYWDSEAAKEPSVCYQKGMRRPHAPVKKKGRKYGDLLLAEGQTANPTEAMPTRNPRNVWSVETRAEDRPTLYEIGMSIAMSMEALRPALPNLWLLPPTPFKGAHFATFPIELAKRCIRSATPEEGCCRFCGTPWKRVLRKLDTTDHDGKTESAYGTGTAANKLALLYQAAREQGKEFHADLRTLGWTPGCLCRGQRGTTKPSLVLDPFAGTGTTGIAARELEQDSVLLDVSAEYIKLMRQRLSDTLKKSKKGKPRPS